MSRTTQDITFNLNERGREHTGVDRSDINIAEWIALINSPKTQEWVKTGSMLGFYGHQVRMLFGMNPPETAFLNGKEYRINPALRTVALSAEQDGTVTHKQEFLDTDAGDHAYRNYKSKIGGFSMATDVKPIGGRRMLSDICGMDYVFQQNYLANACTGVFDSANSEIATNPLVKTAIESSLAVILDSIHDSKMSDLALQEANHRMAMAAELEQKFFMEQARIQRRATLQAERQKQILDNALCPTVDFEQFLADSAQFNDAVQQSKKEKLPVKVFTGFLGGIFG